MVPKFQTWTRWGSLVAALGVGAACAPLGLQPRVGVDTPARAHPSAPSTPPSAASAPTGRTGPTTLLTVPELLERLRQDSLLAATRADSIAHAAIQHDSLALVGRRAEVVRRDTRDSVLTARSTTPPPVLEALTVERSSTGPVIRTLPTPPSPGTVRSKAPAPRPVPAGSAAAGPGTSPAPAAPGSPVMKPKLLRLGGPAPVADSSDTHGRWITKIGKNERVSVDFLQDPLPDVLTLFSRVSGLSIIASDEREVQDKVVTGSIEDKAWYVAFELLLRAHSLRAVQDTATGIVTVQTESRALSSRDPEIIRLKYVNANDILPTLQTIVGHAAGAGDARDATAQADVINTVNTGTDKSNTLLIYTSPEKMAKIRSMVEKIDRKRPTVSIQAKLIFVNRSSMQRIGFSYSIVNKVPALLTPGTTGTGTTGTTGTGTTGTGTTGTGTGVANGQPGVQVSNLGSQYGLGGGYPQNGLQQQGGGTSPTATFSLMQTLALSGAVNLNVFFDVLQSTGLAEVEAAPVITTTSDLEANIQVGEFFILPNATPIFTASGLQGGAGGAGGYGGYGGAQQGIPNQFGGGAGVPFTNGVPGQVTNGGQQGQGNYGNAGTGQQGNYGGMNTGAQYSGAGALPSGAAVGGGGWGSFQTGTNLKVTPYVLPNGRVRMLLDISRDGGTLGADGRTITGGRQSSKTEVTVRNDEVIVIGGLTVAEKTTTHTGIPILGNLPLIGTLFRRTESAVLHQDLIIVVTPHIVYDEDDDLRPAAKTEPATKKPQ